MKTISSTDHSSVRFDRNGDQKRTVRVQSPKIGWIHSLADKPGAKFDLTILDGHGGIRFQRKDFGSEIEKYGELVNIPTFVGEDVQVVVENIRGAEKVDIFVN